MNPTFARLLLATEHGDFDSGAEAVALALARHGGLALACVMPVIGNAEFETVAPQLADQIDTDVSDRREQLLAHASATGVRLDVQVRHGADPAAEIIDEARLQQADLLVIRRRGRRGLLAQLLIGDMVSRVMKHAPCSLLVAPRGAQMWVRRVLVGIDPLAVDVATLGRAAGLAADSNLPLQVVCVAATEAARPQAAQALAGALVQARAICHLSDGVLRVGPLAQELLAAAADAAADLIVIGRHGRDSLGRGSIGGLVQQVTGQATCPVLIHAHDFKDRNP
jgi:nucleotide-binding universal stress UspA family protein